MDSINIRNIFLIIFLYLISVHKVSSAKCLWAYISRLNHNESELSELLTTNKLMLFSAQRNIGSSDSIFDIKQHMKVPTAGQKTNNKDEKVKKTISPVSSKGKKKRLILNNHITQAGGTQNTSIYSYVKNATFFEKFEDFKFDFINYLEELTFVQILISLLTVLIGFSLYQYLNYLFTVEDRGSPYEVPLDLRIPRRDAENPSNVNTVEDRGSQCEFPLDMRYPGRDAEIPSNVYDNEPALIASAMVYSHLQNLVNQIETSKFDENFEKYLTEEFLQTISYRIAEDSFMRSNFQQLLSKESLFMLGKVYYEINRKSGNSSQEKSNEIVTHHCTGNLQHLKVNLNVKVGGQEFKMQV